MKLFSTLLILMFAFCQMAEAHIYYVEDIRIPVSNSNLPSSFHFQASTIKGDANGDGQINVADAMLVVDKVLGGKANGLIASNADVNSDGQINVSDIAIIIDIILNGNNEMGPGDVEDPDVNGN